MTTNNSNISSFNLFYLFISILWQPLQVYYLHVDGAGRTLMILTIIAMVLNLGGKQKGKTVVHSSAFIYWGLLLVYTTINSTYKGFYEDINQWVFLRVSILEPFVVLWVSIIELIRNKERCLHCLLVAMLLYMIMGSTHFVLSEVEEDRVAAEGLGNSLSLRSMVAVFVSAVLFLERKLKGGRWTFIAIVVFALYLIIMSATRKALGASAIILFGTLLGLIKKIDFKASLLLILLAAGFSYSVNYVIDNTLMGQRFETENEKYDVPLSSNTQINDFLMLFLGDRSIQYYEAIQAHKKNPVTGIGIGNFREVTNFPYRLHSEYMVHYCENGWIGFSILMLFYLSIFAGFKRMRRRGQNIGFYLFGLIAVLFINFTAWTYSNTSVMFIYAIILTQIYSEESLPGTIVRKKAIVYHDSPLFHHKIKRLYRSRRYERGTGDILTKKPINPQNTKG